MSSAAVFSREVSEETRWLAPCDQSAYDTNPVIQHSSTDLNNSESTFTMRGLFTGILIGTFTCLMNTYLGLQTGSVNGLPLATALMIGFVATHLVRGPLTGKQTLFAVAVATSASAMPMTAGLLGVIPALQYRAEPDGFEPLEASFVDLVFWSCGICFFGPLLAMPLRNWFLVRKPLPFPTGIALAKVIRMSVRTDLNVTAQLPTTQGHAEAGESLTSRLQQRTQNISPQRVPQLRSEKLVATSFCSAVWTMIIAGIKDWWKLSLLNNPPNCFRLEDAISTVIIGTGMIIGFKVALDACIGVVFGWVVLPFLITLGGREHGSRGGAQVRESRLWHALTALLVDSLMTSVLSFWNTDLLVEKREMSARTEITSSGELTPIPSIVRPQPYHSAVEEIQEVLERPKSNFTLFQICIAPLAASLCCMVTVKLTVGSTIPLWVPLIAIALAMPVSYLGIQAVGVTGTEPVGALAKLSQIVLGIITSIFSLRHAFTINLISGAIAEAGAVQAAGLMHNLKACRELKASPDVILAGQLLGSAWGAIVSTACYTYLTTSHPPGKPGGLDVPGAGMWMAAGKAALNLHWPEPASVGWIGLTAIFFVVCRLMKTANPDRGWISWLPNGSSFAMGLYVNPGVTAARTIGGILQFWWCERNQRDKVDVEMLGSSLMLGNGLGNVLLMIISIAYK